MVKPIEVKLLGGTIEGGILWSRANGEVDYHHCEYHLGCPAYSAGNRPRVGGSRQIPLKKLRPLSTKLLVKEIHSLNSKPSGTHKLYQRTYKALQRLQSEGFIKGNGANNQMGNYVKQWQLTPLGFDLVKAYKKENF